MTPTLRRGEGRGVEMPASSLVPQALGLSLRVSLQWKVSEALLRGPVKFLLQPLRREGSPRKEPRLRAHRCQRSQTLEVLRD